MSASRVLRLFRPSARPDAPGRTAALPRWLCSAAGLGLALVLALCGAPAQAQSLDPAANTGVFGTPGNRAATPSVLGSDTGSGVPGYPGATPGGSAATPGMAAPGLATPTLRQSGFGYAPFQANLPEFLAPRRPLAPAKPSEFQRFVESATGRLLPVFGRGFFEDAQDTYSPLDNVPVPADYTVATGDEVIVRAWGSIDVDYRALVDRNGQINLPKIGSFTVAGTRASDLERQLRAQIGRLYTNFNLSVTLGKLRGIKVFVVGPAEQPGVYTLPSQSTLLAAAVAAGGPGPNGSMRRLSLRRDGRIVSELDIYEFLVQGDKSKDVQLASGDVVVFQPAGPRVAVTGALDTRAIFELKAAQEPLRDVLRYAGGVPVLANPHRAQLERIDPAQPKAARSVEQFGLDEAGLAKTLRDGDVLTLLQISPQFANAVTLKGHVAQPLRYAWTPGMRIRDLIPDKDALISPDFYRRKNLLVQMIDEDEEGSLPRGRGAAPARRDAMRQPGERDAQGGTPQDGQQAAGAEAALAARGSAATEIASGTSPRCPAASTSPRSSSSRARPPSAT